MASRLRAVWAWLRARDLDRFDVLGLVGFGAMEYGIAQWSRPAAWVVAGVLMLVGAVAPHLRRRAS